MHTLALLIERCTYPFCCLMITAGYVINTFLIKDLFEPPASHPLFISMIIIRTRYAWWTYQAGSHTQGCLAALILLLLPQISVFAYMQSNTVVAGTDVRETAEAEGQAAEDHKPLPQWRWVPAVWIRVCMSWCTWFFNGIGVIICLWQKKNQANWRLWL